jgi:hypothetical protein
MAEFVLLLAEAGGPSSCGLCGEEMFLKPGPGLYVSDSRVAVCRRCGRTRAPVLSTLLDLAEAAEQVGRVAAHSRRWVPFELLLEITWASEQYYTSLPADR